MTYTFTDGSGNSATCTFNVNIIECKFQLENNPNLPNSMNFLYGTMGYSLIDINFITIHENNLHTMYIMFFFFFWFLNKA